MSAPDQSHSAKSIADKPVDERLCNNCGKCCYKKIIVGRTVFITPFPCEYLDTQSNLCTIYERRHELNPFCLSIKDGFSVNAFPEDCPYVPEHAPPKYKAAREGWDWSTEWDDFDELADDLDVSAATREKLRARGPLAEPMYVQAYERILEQRDAVIWGQENVVSIPHPAADSPADVPRLSDMAREGSPKAGTKKRP